MGDVAQKLSQTQERVTLSPVPSNTQTLGLDNHTHPILHLQRAIGNHAVLRMLQTYAVSSPGDPFEREADEVADEVMRMAAPAPIGLTLAGIARQRATPDEEEEKTIHTASSTPAHSGEMLDAGAAVRAAEQGGAPLPGEVRSFFEPRFGYDFSRVRVHADGGAAEAASAVEARAYTIGPDIVFGAGEYSPATSEGQRLLAHELVHIVQQGAAAPAAAQRQEVRDAGEVNRSHAFSSVTPTSVTPTSGAFPAKAPEKHVVEEIDGTTGPAAPSPFPVRQRTPSLSLHRQHVHMASGRFVGDRPGADNNLREEVTDVMDRLARLTCLSQPDYSVEYPAVRALPAASSVPAATIPKTTAGIRTAEDPVLDVTSAQHELALTLTSDVGRAKPNAKPDILAIQDQLYAEWHLSNTDYNTEHAAVNALLDAPVPDATVPKTIEAIGKQKVAIVAGLTGTSYRHQLAASLSMERLVGQTATWVPSGPGSGNTFETWASAATEAAAGPLPAVVAATKINCWEMVLVAALQARLITWSWVHSLYTTSVGAGWGAHLVATLTRGTRTPYHPSDPNTPRPNRGQVVFFDGESHVALANGIVDGTGRAQIWTFWPPPGTAFTAGGTVDQVKLSTIEELSSWMAANFGAAPVVQLSRPPW